MEATETVWFAARTRVHQERKAQDRLAQLGVPSFVPVKHVKKRWSDRTKIVEELLIPGVVFVRMTERRRRELFDFVPQIISYMYDRAEQRALIVPDRQMADFMDLCKQNDLDINIVQMAPGDRVRIMEGPLAGKEGILIKTRNDNYFALEIKELGYATISIDPHILIKI